MWMNKMGNREGPPSLRVNSDRHRSPALEQACEPASFAWTPGATGGPVAQEREATMGRGRVSKPVQRDTLGEEERNPQQRRRALRPFRLDNPPNPSPFDQN